MADQIPSSASKRTYKEFMVQDLAGKLRSKKDFYIYLDKHVSWINFVTDIFLVIILLSTEILSQQGLLASCFRRLKEVAEEE